MRYLTKLAALAVTVVAMLSFAVSASAATAPGYGEFADCPDKSVSTTITFCTNAVVHGGHLEMGSKDTPITDPIKIAGAITLNGTYFLGSFDGGSQTVPGGLVGITGLNWLALVFPTLLGVKAEAELAGTPTNPNAANVTLPLKVKLVNPLLANGCYIGSNTDPIDLHLTTGTTAPPPPNTPITGFQGTLVQPLPGQPLISRVDDRRLVDNAFAAPAARGCGLLLPGLGAIDALVNLQSGLPSPAGTNEAIQIADGALSSVNRVFPPAGIETP